MDPSREAVRKLRKLVGTMRTMCRSSTPVVKRINELEKWLDAHIEELKSSEKSEEMKKIQSYLEAKLGEMKRAKEAANVEAEESGRRVYVKWDAVVIRFLIRGSYVDRIDLLMTSTQAEVEDLDKFLRRGSRSGGGSPFVARDRGTEPPAHVLNCQACEPALDRTAFSSVLQPSSTDAPQARREGFSDSSPFSGVTSRRKPFDRAPFFPDAQR